MLGTHAASVALKQVAEIMNLEVARSDVTDLGSWVDLMRSTASLMAEKASLILSVADDWRVTADKLAPYA